MHFSTTHTHSPSTLAENHSTCLAGLPVDTEEQKQAASVASASAQESCHCMHCNELLITLSVWGTRTCNTRMKLCVCVFYFQCAYGAIIFVSV